MIHSKEIVRDDGTQVVIDVELFETGNILKWRVRVYVFEEQEGGYWRNVYSVTRAESLPSNERPKYRRDCMLRVVSAEEIYQAKTELMETIKPTLGEI